MRCCSLPSAFALVQWPTLLAVACALVGLSLTSCGAPRLNNPEPSPPSDDDDDVVQEDPCCEAGDEDTWLNCLEEDLAVECVCAIDPFCCSDFWDPECASSYTSPCGALTCGN